MLCEFQLQSDSHLWSGGSPVTEQRSELQAGVKEALREQGKMMAEAAKLQLELCFTNRGPTHPMLCFFFIHLFILKFCTVPARDMYMSKEAVKARFIDSLEFNHFQIIQSLWKYRDPLAHLSIHTLTRPFICSSIHLFAHSLIHSFICSFAHLSIHSLIHSSIYVLMSISLKHCAWRYWWFLNPISWPQISLLQLGILFSTVPGSRSASTDPAHVKKALLRRGLLFLSVCSWVISSREW